MAHHCKTLIIHCIDFRLGKAIKKYLEEQNLLGNCDIVSVAGATKNLVSPENDSERAFLMKQIDISKKLHHITDIILMNHSDCGAYGSPRFTGEAGGSSTFGSKEEEKKKHFEDMEQAASMILEKYPDLNIKKMFAEIDDSGNVLLIADSK